MENTVEDLLALFGNMTATESECPEAERFTLIKNAEIRADNYGIDSIEYDDIYTKEYRRDNRNCLREVRKQIYRAKNAEIIASGTACSRQYRIILTDAGTIDQVRIDTEGAFEGKKIHAYVINLSAPSSLDELEWILQFSNPPMLDIEIALSGEPCSWTSPRWGKVGDIIFFTHGKSAIAKISSTKTALKHSRAWYSDKEFEELSALIDKERSLHASYGGTIFAVGRLSGAPEMMNEEDIAEGFHFKTRVFANVDSMFILDNPVNVDDCKDFLQIAMTSGITPVEGDVFDKLIETIKMNNVIPKYLEDADATPIALSKINENNWMTLSTDFRRAFMYEAQFRHFYVDFLLKTIATKKKVYRECGCKKEGIGYSFIDNVILFGDKYLPVEVKLNIQLEKDIYAQVRKYCYDDFILLDKKTQKMVSGENVFLNRVLIVDTHSVFLFDFEKDEIESLIELDELVNQESVCVLREMIAERLN